ncbi:DNA-processing protein DprA [Candidatus Deferrimicrobium sp.]|uniref:DNA-processing protein DprA n=1 Tax=Candidatus Deferrimicrobium sp. TaxID=3060586 RepID=UPI002ED1B1CA
MDDSASTASLLDTFLRLSLIEGFTVDHLRRFRASGSGGFLPGMTPRGVSPLGKAKAALGSVEAGRRAEAVRETCVRLGIAILPWGASDYPVPLREIPGAPLLLYRAGKAWTVGGAVAVVGSRASTGPGREFARILSGALAAAGWTVVSGMARGIDAAAHKGALQSGGTTVAVLGCGVDVAYPREHAELRDEILEQGAIFSDYPPGSLPLPHRFPERNRIVSGLSRGVIVAEAPERSGAMIAARLALEQGREVMVVPGNPWFAHTAGSNRLLREGATPVCSVADFHGVLGCPPPVAVSGVAKRVLDALSGVMHVVEIAEVVSVPVQELLPCLMEMELANLVEKRPGNYYKKLSASGS